MIERYLIVSQSLRMLSFFCVVASAALAAATSLHIQGHRNGPLILQDAGDFFVGGREVKTLVNTGDRSNPLFDYPPEDWIFVDQMYVEYQIPMNGTNHLPYILVHGCCLSGKTYQNTPDGRMGWAEYLVRKGHPVYIPDQTSRARSGFDPTIFNQVQLGEVAPSALPRIEIAGRQRAWDLFRFGYTYPQVFPGLQYPIEAMAELSKQVIPDLNAMLPNPNPTYANLASLASKVHGAVLVGHSESAFFPFYAALNNSSAVRGIVSIEGQCPTLTDEEIAVLATIPTLFVYGDYLDQAKVSRRVWPQSLQGCQAVVDRLTAAGGRAFMAELPKLGIYGNSHMMMQDKNNLQIADFIMDWIEENVDN
ncbi:Alpha/Beta hydrolase protein [Aspergillus flavus]|uniref:Alpha/Beta hydrolase protein n=1 Tax=Aspergillus flavus (strain ATCC 200026 / FGSC A1120 / IAM 13836 / NRRL 3357 / JCM 12722 / SRRC 167) TaxID=332952 RepID=A0A7U2R1R3_ASPFN|nr:Alpha/Beta hydrolase protein [Aspergillus flavus]